LDAFKVKLKEAHAVFPDSFVENVDRLILSMHPKYKKIIKSTKSLGKRKASDEGLNDLERKKRLFPGLAMQDKEASSSVSDDGIGRSGCREVHSSTFRGR
jgi:ATP-dependent RNA helicase DHX8/PRP22